MGRRKGFIAEMSRIQREQEKERLHRFKDQQRQAKALQKAQQDYARSIALQTREAARVQAMDAKARAKYEKEQEKEKQRLHLEAREAEVELAQAEMESKLADLDNILGATLQVDDYIDLNKLKDIATYPALYIPPQLLVESRKPVWSEYEPPAPQGISKLIPGTSRKYEESIAQSKVRFNETLGKYEAREKERQKQINQIKARYDQMVTEIQGRVKAQHTEIDDFEMRLGFGEATAIIDYCKLVLESSSYPEDFPQRAKLAYIPESKQLVVEYDLPTMRVVPKEAGYKYVKARDEIASTARPATQCKTLYASIIAQLTLRTVHELFEADRAHHIDTIVFNGHVETVDRATGQDIRPCLITLRTTRDVFTKIDLARVDPESCLKNLSASVSKNPSELAAVRPVVDFNMVDPRFVEEADVLSTLDTRTNLMGLSPSEFESLITNLFHKMGLRHGKLKRLEMVA